MNIIGYHLCYNRRKAHHWHRELGCHITLMNSRRYRSANNLEGGLQIDLANTVETSDAVFFQPTNRTISVRSSKASTFFRH